MLAIANTLVEETCRLVMVRWRLGEAVFCVVKASCVRLLFAPLIEFKLAGRTGHPHRKRVSPFTLLA